MRAGVHLLCVKDMAGLLRPPAAHTLVTALRENFDLPVHLHTHDTAGGQLATYLAAAAAGVDAVDGASAALSGTTSQPALSAIVAATDHTERATGLSLDALCELEPYWAAVRTLYGPFESGLPAPTGRVYQHEIPGGQLSNLRQQAAALGLADRFGQVERLYAAADRILGRIIKVTPTSKVVGDLALHLAAVDADPAGFEADPGAFDIPESVIGFLAGELGTPPGGWPEPFRTKALAGRTVPDQGVTLTPEQEAALDGEDVRRALDELLFPGPSREYRASLSEGGDLSVLPTTAFLYGMRPEEEVCAELSAGVSLYLGLDAIGEPDERGHRTVFCRLNGQPRTVSVRDRSIEASKPARERADAANPRHIAAPFSGVVTTTVRPGDEVSAGQSIATIEAMKMEASITTPVAGTVDRLAIAEVAGVDGGDLLVVIR